jgi:hypothetical protein
MGLLAVRARCFLNAWKKNATGFMTIEYSMSGKWARAAELAPADDAFLRVLVVIDAPQQQMKRRVIKKPAAAATIARPEARHADQPLDVSLLHRGVMLPVGPAWLTVMCDAGNRTARWAARCRCEFDADVAINREDTRSRRDWR